MKINVMHCNKITKEGVWTIGGSGLFEVDAFKIERIGSWKERLVNRYRYKVHYIAVDGMMDIVTKGSDEGNECCKIMDRKLNPKFKPENVIFIDDVAIIW